ncbi:CGNR zinc finger domain-containing protein [Actinomadura violacea]|uniref:CGNR zinc finger domain-containing protein n=1 Tax=Actinomadura violacea TaxID=2819934 RepID=A0ABS3RWN6_9ACTN|nr:CGNR zinc finger domain-containing protein [Actinomadura violacea]MBO2460878.1 CGNR zinc finger domain-containing protein [Actinomadura violacea]
MEFTFVSGDLALDLAGTVQHRRDDRRDLLTSPGDLARWSAAAGLLTDPPEMSAGDLAAAVALREAIYRCATAVLHGAPLAAADRGLINLRAAAAPPVPRLTAGGAVHRDGDAAAVLAAAARAAVDLLAAAAAPGGDDTDGADGTGRGVLKQCQADPCTRLYLDTSRRRTRRWCDMRQCGNRAKAAAFRARRTPGRDG